MLFRSQQQKEHLNLSYPSSFSGSIFLCVRHRLNQTEAILKKAKQILTSLAYFCNIEPLY